MRAINLKTEHLTDPIGIDIARPYLSWTCEGGIAQTACEVEVMEGENLFWNSGKICSPQMHVILEKELQSRQRVSWRVRLWDEAGRAGTWSDPAVFEMGIIDKALFQAAWINPELVCDPELHKPASYLKKRFYAAKGTTARLYITCHGLYEAYINGKRVGDVVLAPGCYNYDRKVAERARKAFRYIALEDGRIRSDRQAEYVRAITFELLTEEERRQAADDLDRLVQQKDYHLNTGFLSTPQLCAVLADYGHVETAYQLLLQDTMPGWLYQVKKGATTIWETWDGINEEGVPSASLNHYSKGAVTGWLFEGVCGIRLAGGGIRITPQPCKMLDYAKAVYHSPVGDIESGWRCEAGKFVYEFVIPANTSADIVLPDGRREHVAAGRHCF